MLLALVIMVVWFGVGPLQFAYADQMRNMLSVVPMVMPSANVVPSASVVPSANVVPSASVVPSANGKK